MTRRKKRFDGTRFNPRANTLQVNFVIVRNDSSNPESKAEVLACGRRDNGRSQRCASAKGATAGAAMRTALDRFVQRRFIPKSEVIKIENRSEEIWGERLKQQAEAAPKRKKGE